LRAKTGRLYWCFVDFEKEFDSINNEALWLKIRKTGVSENMINCIKNNVSGYKILYEV
jgi:hypothetical protein